MARIGLFAAVALCMPYVAHAQDTSPQHHAVSCESLGSLALPDATITAAQSIPAGTYRPPGSPTPFSDLPAFCRVTATLTPVPDSSIGIEVWLPMDTWNGNYQQSGNHGFAGSLHWEEMAPQLQRGYATAVTDDGHVASAPFDVSWAFGHPETITDLAWRGVHETAVNAKLLIAVFYGRPPAYAYFNGCSDGGREGMKSAQMFPADFDGIIAGAAAAEWTHAATEQLFMSESLMLLWSVKGRLWPYGETPAGVVTCWIEGSSVR